MFPTVSHFIEYLFGFSVPLPFNTFGVFVALAFVAGYWAFSKELQRKEAEGLIKPFKKKIVVGKAPDTAGLLLNGVFGFAVGYKLVYALLNYSAFVEDAPSVLLSAEGSFIGGILFAALFVYWDYKEKKAKALPRPQEKEILVHPHELMSTLIVWAAIWGFLGAKIFDNLEYWDEFIKDPIGRLMAFSGLTFYGGLICGGAAVLYIARKHGIKPLHMLDVGAPGMMLAYAVGRIGCQLSGDGDWGIVNAKANPFSWLPDWMWSFKYPHNVVNEGVPIAGCTGRFCHELPIGVYPTPFYEVIMASILFFILWQIRHRIKGPGMLFGIYMIFAGIERFLIELIRVNSKYQVAGISFTQAEMISVFMVLGGIALIYNARNMKKNGVIY